ncbi:MAG TPA: hypothetical protein VF691_01960 [Cytophagaceae bacterium]|jgi:hypothetical protein
MANEQKLERFREIFWDAFHEPRLKSEAALTVFQSLEQLNSILAGPLFSIYEKGNCDFVFDDNLRFPTVKTNADLFERNISIINLYREKIEKMEIKSSEDEGDKKVLLYQVDLKMELADLAYSLFE